jgi:hypothetical protein
MRCGIDCVLRPRSEKGPTASKDHFRRLLGSGMGLRIELPQRVDFAQDIGMDPAIVIDVELSDSQIGRKVVIDELAAEAGLRNERQPPAARRY